MKLGTHPEYLALLRAVLATPDDDLPRLVLADWLEEHDEAVWAKFVRLQSEIRTGSHMTLNANRYLFRRVYDPALPPSVEHLGFISEIHCTLAEFRGGECSTCALTGIPGLITDGSGGHRRPCPACMGTGHIPGLVDTIFREHPITHVVLTDRDPRDVGDPRKWWYWRPADRSQYDSLPQSLFDFLDGYERADPNFKCYLTRLLADAALSRACVDLGRRTCGLRTLQRKGGE